MRGFIVFGLVFFMTSYAAAFQPRTGHWNNLNESGRGFNIDIQDGVIVLTFYSYDANGNAQWYIASGTMTNGQHNFTGTLDKFVNGQCASCNYQPPATNGHDGTISVVFTSETQATVTLPGGHVTTIRPFNFKFGEPPQGLLGQWIYVYDIGPITFAERFDYAAIGNPTTDGNGVVHDGPRSAGCEQVVRGTLAGTVLCVDLNASGAISNLYKFNFGLDETFNGFWISPTTATQYAMKGFKIKSPSGFTKAATKERDDSGSKAALEATVGDGTPASAGLMEAFESLANRLR